MTAVGDAISRVTSDSRIATAMLLGALLEGGSLDGPWPPGDQGTSFGPWQIHLPAHPTVSQRAAEDPLSAALVMLPEYAAAVAQVPTSAWATSPMDAAARAVYLAERPAQMYPAARVAAAWAKLGLAGAATPSSPPAAVTTLSWQGDIANAVGQAIWGQITGIFTAQRMQALAFGVIGIAAVGIGLYVALS